MANSHYRGVAKRKVVRGVYSPTRKLWTNLGRIEFALHIDEENDADGVLPSHGIVIKSASMSRGFRVDLTDMTEQELLSVRKFLNESIDGALPLVRQLDEHAKEMSDHGDHHYPRLYRQVPVYVDLRGEKPEYHQGVPSGPGSDQGAPPDGGPRIPRTALRSAPDGEPIDLGTPDDDPQAGGDAVPW
jgi:hypothetical protein